VQRIQGDKSVNSFIRACELELEELKSSDSKGNFWKSVAYLKKNGFNIDPMKTSVSEFYSCFKILKDARAEINTSVNE